MAQKSGASIQLIGLDKAADKYAIRARNIRNNRGLVMRILTKWHQITVRNFNSSGGAHVPPDRWPFLSFSTLIQKRRQGYSAKPLIRTGQLKRGWIMRAGSRPGSGVLQSTTSYGKFHHTGARGGRLPKRRFVPKEDHAQAVAHDITKGFVKVSVEV